jgi:hypothetical protein
MGRFLGVDPASVVAGDVYSFGRYVYGKNNPIFWLDPNGRQSSCPVECVAVRDESGQVMYVPSVVAPSSYMAVRTGSNLSDYVNPEFDNHAAAAAADKGKIAAAGGALLASEVPPAAGFLGLTSETMAVAAFLFEPTPGRFIDLMVMGSFKGLKASAQGKPDVLKAIERANRAADMGDLFKAGQEQEQEQKDQERRKRDQEERQHRRQIIRDMIW